MAHRFFRTDGLPRLSVSDVVLERLGPGMALQDRAALVELICPLEPGKDPGPLPRVELTTVAARHGALTLLLTTLSEERPIILWLDDAQWGAEAVDFALQLIGARRLPVLVVATVRNPPLAAQPLLELDGHVAASIDVPVLTLEHGLSFMADLVGLDGELARQVQERSAGVPLFAVQLVGDWIRRGILEVGSHGFQVREGAHVELPDELHDLFMSQVADALRDRPQSDTIALELASVLGRDVRHEEWEQACRERGVEVPTGLVRALATRNLVRRDETNSWSFVHGMLVESVDRCAREAGRSASARRACSLALSEVARGHGKHGDIRRGLEVATRAEEIAGETRPEAVAVARQGILLLDRGRCAEARARLHRALTAFQEIGDAPWQADCEVFLGVADYHEGKHEAAERRLLTAIGIARAHDLPTRLRLARGNLANVLQFLDRLDEAVTLIQEERAACMAAGDLRSAAKADTNLGIVRWRQGRWDDARALWRDALAGHRQLGNRRSEANVLGNLAYLSTYQGRTTEAKQGLGEALELNRAVENGMSEANTLYHLGLLELQRDDLAAALRYAEQALALSMPGNWRHQIAMHRSLASIVHLRQREFDAARAELDRALDTLGDSGNDPIRVDLHTLAAEIALAEEDLMAASESLTAAQAAWERCGAQHNRAMMLCQQAVLQMRRGNASAARQSLDIADEIADALGILEGGPLRTALSRAAQAVHRLG